MRENLCAMPCVTFIAAVLAVICACKSGEDKPKPPPPPTDGIELVQPGNEPRHALRYKLAPGAVTALEVATDLDAKLADLDAMLPTLVLGVDLMATTVEPDGTARMKLTVVTGKAVSRSEADAPAMPVMERQAKQLVGMVVTYTLSPIGEIKETKVEETGRDLSEPMQEQTRTLLQASEQLAMTLPDKPIGVGAIWKHRRTMKQNQLTVVTVTMVEVTAIDGDVLAFKSTMEMTGADQTLAQGSATMQVTRVGGAGTGTGTFDLAKAIVTGETRASMGFEIIAEPPRPTKMDVVYRITPRTDAK
jgi:hypothetical protein